jgi:hypothetical protein
MDDLKVECNLEEEMQPSGNDIQHIKINQEETEPINFVEVKCELEVRQAIGLEYKHSFQRVEDYYFHPGIRLGLC